jgi:hypothetical protein
MGASETTRGTVEAIASLASQAGTGASLPLTVIGSTASQRIAFRQARRVSSPIRMPPCGATS